MKQKDLFYSLSTTVILFFSTSNGVTASAFFLGQKLCATDKSDPEVTLMISIKSDLVVTDLQDVGSLKEKDNIQVQQAQIDQPRTVNELFNEAKYAKILFEALMPEPNGRSKYQVKIQKEKYNESYGFYNETIVRTKTAPGLIPPEKLPVGFRRLLRDQNQEVRPEFDNFTTEKRLFLPRENLNTFSVANDLGTIISENIFSLAAQPLSRDEKKEFDDLVKWASRTHFVQRDKKYNYRPRTADGLLIHVFEQAEFMRRPVSDSDLDFHPVISKSDLETIKKIREQL